MLPEYKPAIGVCMPLALPTALRVNAPVVGIDDTKLPNILQRPSVSISCVALTAASIAIFILSIFIKLIKD